MNIGKLQAAHILVDRHQCPLPKIRLIKELAFPFVKRLTQRSRANDQRDSARGTRLKASGLRSGWHRNSESHPKPKGGTVISVEELERTKNPACIREGDLCRRNCRPCLLVCRKGGLRSRRNCCSHDRMRAKPALFARGERSFRATDGQGRRRCDPGLI